MRMRSTFFVAASAAALLAMSAATASAQDEGCVGTLEFGEDGMVWDASDPRLSGDASGSGGWSLYEPPSEDAGSPDEGIASYIIINEDGSWSCAESAPAGPEHDLTGHTLVFTGTGDYEGLTAHVRIDWSTYPASFTGVIVEGQTPDDPALAG